MQRHCGTKAFLSIIGHLQRHTAERPTLRIELLLKLFFGHLVPAQNLIQKVEDEKRFCERTLETFDQIEHHVKSVTSGKKLTGVHYWLITLRYGQHSYKAVRTWCEETLEILKKSDEMTGEKK